MFFFFLLSTYVRYGTKAVSVARHATNRWIRCWLVTDRTKKFIVNLVTVDNTARKDLATDTRRL